MLPSQLSAADKRRQLAFGRLYVADEFVFVLQQIDVGPRDVAMEQALFDLADDKIEPVSSERALRLPFEAVQVVDRDGALDAGAERHFGEVGFAARGRRL